MHAFDQIHESRKSIIRNQLYRVLREYALNGNHNAIHPIRVFLKTADHLVEEGILNPTHNGSPYISFVEAYAFFPNYELPDFVADFIRQSMWDLFIQSVLAPTTYLSPIPNVQSPVLFGL